MVEILSGISDNGATPVKVGRPGENSERKLIKSST